MQLSNKKFGSASDPFRASPYIQTDQSFAGNVPHDLFNVIDIDNNNVVTIDGYQVVALEN